MIPIQYLRRQLLAALLLCSGTAHAIVLESWTTPFPPSPCLPNTAQRVVFTGFLCDAPGCPPGVPIDSHDGPQECANLDQAGIAGSFGGGRYASAYSNSNYAGTVTMRVDSPESRLVIASAEPAGYYVQIGWDHGAEGWNLDLGSIASIDFSMSGDITPERPVHVRVLLFCDVPPGTIGDAPWAERWLAVSAPGTLSVPLASLAVLGALFDVHSVDGIQLDFSNCAEFGEDCSSASLPQTFSIGALRLEPGQVTPTVHRSWGALKVHHR